MVTLTGDATSLRDREITVSRSLACSSALGALLLLVVQDALPQAMYRIKPLGTLNGCTHTAPAVAGLTNTGKVAGTACYMHGYRHAFVWKNDGGPMVDLGPSTAGTSSSARGINASGVVVGNAQDGTGQYAFLSSGDGRPMRKIYNPWGRITIRAFALNDRGWVTGQAARDNGDGEAPRPFVWKNDGSPLVDLGVCCGYDWGWGRAINASGQIAGSSRAFGSTNAEATSWRSNGSIVPLGTLSSGLTGEANFINAHGQVAGDNATSGDADNHAFFWRNDGTPMQDLGTLGGALSFATGLNDAGQVAGWSTVRRPDPYRYAHAFVWLNDGTPMRDLGTFGGTESEANDINATGQVTGWAYPAGDTIRHALLWRNDGSRAQDLNALIDPTDPLKPYITLTVGRLINDQGNIVADGTDSRTRKQGLYFLQGTMLTLAPRALAFGNQAINTTSAARAVTVTNTGSKAAPITKIVLAGTGAGQFAFTHNCGTSLAGRATCTIRVTFEPTTRGAKSATLSVNGGGGGLRLVALTGSGT